MSTKGTKEVPEEIKEVLQDLEFLGLVKTHEENGELYYKFTEKFWELMIKHRKDYVTALFALMEYSFHMWFDTIFLITYELVLMVEDKIRELEAGGSDD